MMQRSNEKSNGHGRVANMPPQWPSNADEEDSESNGQSSSSDDEEDDHCESSSLESSSYKSDNNSYHSSYSTSSSSSASRDRGRYPTGRSSLFESTLVALQNPFSSNARRRRQRLDKAMTPSHRPDDNHLGHNTTKRPLDYYHGDKEKKDQHFDNLSGGAASTLLPSPSKQRRQQCHRSNTVSLEKQRNKQRQFHWSTYLLILSLMLWTYVQFVCYQQESASSPTLSAEQFLSSFHNTASLSTTPTSSDEQQKRMTSPRYNHIPNALDGNGHSVGHARQPKHPAAKKPDKEALPPGCDHVQWQQPQRMSSLLDCNVLHELDLKLLLGRSFPTSKHNRRTGRTGLSSNRLWNYTNNMTQEEDDITKDKVPDSDSSPSLGRYLSSGLWRDVWSIRSSHDYFAETASSVLKMMKIEHDLTARNFERHRREAVTMEHLTQSPHVVDLYAYCGNTILTEFAPSDLSTALGTDNSKKRPKRNDGSLAVTRGEGNIDGTSKLDSDSVFRRLDMALQAATAIETLHDNNIIHADLTSKQFLLIKAATSHSTTMLKVNDFNRCRFVPYNFGNATASSSNITTGEMCPVRIATAPGLYRSPEEYVGKNLTTQMDIFSLGHVLFEIWTGTKAWGDIGGKRIREQVQEGHLPPGVEELLVRNKDGDKDATSIDQLMGRLIADCYKVDPTHRITAKQLVKELKELVSQHTLRNKS